MKPQIKSSIVLIVLVGLIGLFIDAANGFHILKSSKSVIGWVLGVMAFAALYLVGEIGVDFINSKDNATTPLIKRAFHLLMILLIVGAVISVSIYKF